MLVCADENEDLGVDVKGTLEAAHEAINSFFMLHALFEDEARVWYHFQNRAFSEAVREQPTSFHDLSGRNVADPGVAA